MGADIIGKRIHVLKSGKILRSNEFELEGILIPSRPSGLLYDNKLYVIGIPPISPDLLYDYGLYVRINDLQVYRADSIYNEPKRYCIIIPKFLTSLDSKMCIPSLYITEDYLYYYADETIHSVSLIDVTDVSTEDVKGKVGITIREDQIYMDALRTYTILDPTSLDIDLIVYPSVYKKVVVDFMASSSKPFKLLFLWSDTENVSGAYSKNNFKQYYSYSADWRGNYTCESVFTIDIESNIIPYIYVVPIDGSGIDLIVRVDMI